MVMPNSEYPFGNGVFPSFDFARMMADFKVPGIDWSVIVAGQKSNIEALTSANKVAFEAAQQISKRQSEILRQNIEEVVRLFSSSKGDGHNISTSEQMVRQSEFVKFAVERSLSSMRELVEMVANAQKNTLEVVNARVAAGLEELKDVVGKK